MFWTIEKLDMRIQELRAWRYREMVDIRDWAFAVDHEEQVGAYPPDFTPEKWMNQGDHWRGRGMYVWLRNTFELPASWSGKTIVGLFDFGKTGGGANMGFESLLFVNGKPYQGVDQYHQETILPSELAGQNIDLCFRLWSGLEGGGEPQEQEHQFRKAAIGILDARVDNLYFTSKAVLDSLRLLSEDRMEHHQLLQALDRAYLRIDWSVPGSDPFYTSLYEAEAELDQALEGLAATHPVTIHCIGHTHIDVAWLWRIAHTREKSARSFSTVLRLMEQYPEYVFLQTQPQLYAYIKKDYPEIYAQIKQRVQEGRWEAAGGMWLEADCILPSGESLVRQFLHGTRFFRDEFGTECDYLWLPDVFGYSWALPQILSKSGIRTFMTTKISWNQYNRMPHDTFVWRGIDGSEVLTHFITTPDVPGSTVWWYTFNGFTDPFAVKGIWDTYRDKSINNELLLSYGYGDGGGGVNRDMLETRRRLERMPGIPRAVPGRADEFFQGLHERVASTDQYVHTWDGELYLEYHRGTYTSEAYNKRMNRKMELLLRDAEWVQTLAAVATGDWKGYPVEALADSWTTVLRNQFHDIIPGSSITEVYEDSRVEYESAHSQTIQVWETAAERLKSEESGSALAFTVYNSSSFSRDDLVSIAVADTGVSGVWRDERGGELRAQRSGEHWLIHLPQLAELSAQTLLFEPKEAGVREANEPSLFSFAQGQLTTPHYLIQVNEQGQFTSIYDRHAKREVLAAGARGNVLQVFEDKPKAFDAWDIDLFYQQKQREVSSLTSITFVNEGSLRATLTLEWAYGQSTIRQNVHCYTHSRRIDFETHVDWHERQQLLKVAFPVHVRAVEATYDIQFGNVKRPTHWNTSWDYARFETVGHQWADLSEWNYGVSLLNDCKYGYDIKDNVMRLSLIKSAIHPNTRADQGEHRFTYALLPHAGDWRAGSVPQEAWMLNAPMTYKPGASIAAGKSLFIASTDSIMVDAIKKAEDANTVLLRFHDYTGSRYEATIKSDYPVVAWQECDLMERPIAEEVSEGAIRTEVKPYEIKTFLVKFAYDCVPE